jgi:hypothetical protein
MAFLLLGCALSGGTCAGVDSFHKDIPEQAPAPTSYTITAPSGAKFAFCSW